MSKAYSKGQFTKGEPDEKSIHLLTVAIAVALTALALADDVAVDVDHMVEHSAPKSYDSVTAAIGQLDIDSLNGARNLDFMATMTSCFAPGYRLNQPVQSF